MRVIIAQNAGFCSSVTHVIAEVEKIVTSSQLPVFSTGPLIHNPLEIARLKSLGIIPSDAPWNLKNRKVVICTHGITVLLNQRLYKNNNEVIDFTCPNVKKVQNIVSEYHSQGYFTVIVGNQGHPEVKSIKSFAKEKSIIIDDKREIFKIPSDEKKICVVSQTTAPKEKFLDVCEIIKKIFSEVAVCNTFCPSVELRIKTSVELAASCDFFIVIGGYTSSNTRTLFTSCLSANPNTIHIETCEELKEKLKNWGASKNLDEKVMGITAGASTPHWQIEEIKREIDLIHKIL